MAKIVIHVPLTLTFERDEEELRNWFNLEEDDPAPTIEQIVEILENEVEPELLAYLEEASDYSVGEVKVEITDR